VSAAGGGLPRRRFLALLAAPAVTSCAAGAATSGPARDASTGILGPRGFGPGGRNGSPVRAPDWLLARSALADVASNDAVAAGLARTRVYELVQPGQQPLGLAGALPAVVFSSADMLIDAVGAGNVPARTQAVVYDPEAWALTPLSEQLDPAGAVARAAAAARGRGLQFIAAPALNLTTVLAPGSLLPRWQSFLELGLAGRIAEHADVLEFQAQSLERDAASYAGFVAAAAHQARRANPGAALLAGVSTNPPGAAVDAGQLVAAIRSVAGLVDGYWLNVPRPGVRCPTCNPARPDIAVETLLEVL
jgi:hypothetical protein